MISLPFNLRSKHIMVHTTYFIFSFLLSIALNITVCLMIDSNNKCFGLHVLFAFLFFIMTSLLGLPIYPLHLWDIYIGQLILYNMWSSCVNPSCILEIHWSVFLVLFLLESFCIHSVSFEANLMTDYY